MVFSGPPSGCYCRSSGSGSGNVARQNLGRTAIVPGQKARAFSLEPRISKSKLGFLNFKRVQDVASLSIFFEQAKILTCVTLYQE
jgi:hypothetical protein